MNITNANKWYENQLMVGYEDAYAATHLFLDTIDSGSVFVEIGSDRFVGSTQYYANLAQKYNTVLFSVDITTNARERIEHSHIVWQTEVGSNWAKNIYPTIDKKISVLFLDNQDYIWNADTLEKQNSNTDCQTEHFTQLFYLYSWLTDDCIVVLDDTYRYNGCWVGKGGACVIFLLSMGFKIVWEADLEKNSLRGYNTAGVIMKRNL